MKYFSAFASGFQQIPVFPDQEKHAALSTHKRHWQFKQMSMGLKNVPASFQRITNSKLRGLIDKIYLVYLDDIVVYSKTYEEHIENLKILFERLKNAAAAV